MSQSSETRTDTTFRAAARKVDITPDDLTNLNPIGGGSFVGVHDRLALRVLLLEDGTSTVAIVSTDLIEVGDTRRIRARIETELAIPADRVIITASHSHSAPRLGRVSPGALAHDGGPESDAYAETVYERLIDALRDARDSLRPAKVYYATGSADVNVNRDVWADGRWWLGFNAEGRSDKTVRLIHVEGTDGVPIAVVLNYAVHSVTTLGSGAVSADIAGAAERYVEAALGHDAVALWTLGSVADQNPRIQLGFPGTFSAREIEAAFAASEAQGVMIGAEAVRAIRAASWTEVEPHLHAEQRVIPSPTKRGAEVMSTMRQQEVDLVDLRLSLILIGGIAIAGVSGEITTPIADRVREQSPLSATVLLSMANDRIGYLPDDESFARGTFAANGSPIREGHVESVIVDGLVDMIRSAGR